MWNPQRLTTLWASMACYRYSFTFFLLLQFFLSIYQSMLPYFHLTTHFSLYLSTLFPFDATDRPFQINPSIHPHLRYTHISIHPSPMLLLMNYIHPSANQSINPLLSSPSHRWTDSLRSSEEPLYHSSRPQHQQVSRRVHTSSPVITWSLKR
jgi:hypothetical protein